jgi:hypothetical protein
MFYNQKIPDKEKIIKNKFYKEIGFSIYSFTITRLEFIVVRLDFFILLLLLLLFLVSSAYYKNIKL